MGTRAYIGIQDPDRPGMARLRYVHMDGDPESMIHAVRRIWVTTAARDTRQLITLLLEFDWYRLRAETTTADRLPDAEPVPGVGSFLAFVDFRTGMVTPPDPFPLVVAFAQPGDLDGEWIYLIDPTDDTVVVYTIHGTLVGTHPLAL